MKHFLKSGHSVYNWPKKSRCPKMKVNYKKTEQVPILLLRAASSLSDAKNPSKWILEIHNPIYSISDPDR